MNNDLLRTIVITESINHLYESKLEKPSIVRTLIDFANLVKDEVDWALGGGLAIGFRAKPRATLDIDVFFKSEDDLHAAYNLIKKKFTLERGFRAVHKETGIQLDILTAEMLGFDDDIAAIAINNATTENIYGHEIPVIDSAGLIALKLQRGRFKDKGDIEEILLKNGYIDVSQYPLRDHQKKEYENIVKQTLP